MILAGPALAKSWAAYNAENFQRHDNSDDLRSAVKDMEIDVDGMPIGHPDLADCQLSLAGFYNKHFEMLGDMDDLESVLKYLKAAVDVTPPGHPHLAGCLQDLAMLGFRTGTGLPAVFGPRVTRVRVRCRISAPAWIPYP